MLIDSHCHLNFPDFEGKLDEVVSEATKNGVSHMQTICTKISEFEDIKAISNKYGNIWCSVGVHPNNVAEAEISTTSELVSLAKSFDKVIGIGETGLDYYYENSPRELQQKSFINHIGAARELQLPVIVHTRAADEDTVEILQKQTAKGAFPGLIHCFSTSSYLAHAAIELGMYISISGIVTFKKAHELQDIVKDLPLERLLVETDAPYLAPVPFRGKTNQPAYTRHTAQFIADLKGISYEEVERVTTQNFFNLFQAAKIL